MSHVQRFCLSLLSLLCCTAYAASPNEESESSFLAELPIVLTPSRLQEPLDAVPAAVTVIDRKLIHATGYRDLPRLLRLVPGMQIGQERGHFHWVTYHGLGSNNPSLMQVLIDGRSVYSASNFNGVDWNSLAISIDEIDRIEVYRGTHSTTYGANAFLGVINIITRHSSLEPGFKFSSRVGNAGIRDIHLEKGWMYQGGSARINGNFKQDNGFKRLNDAQLFRSAAFRIDHRLGPSDEINLRLAGKQGDTGLGYPNTTYNNNGLRSAENNNSSFHLQWHHTRHQEEEWLWSFYHNYDDIAESWQAIGPPPDNAIVPLDRNRESHRDSLELQYRNALSPTLSTLSGIELRHDEIHSPFLFYGAPEQRSTLARLFAKFDWRLSEKWKLNTGLQLEKHSGNKLKASPSIFLNWKPYAAETWRIGYTNAWLQPAQFSRLGDVRAYHPSNGSLLVHPYVPNPALRPARIKSFELDYLRQFAFWNSTLDIRLFSERLDGYIARVLLPPDPAVVLSNTLPSSRYENLSQPVKLNGIEYQFDSQPKVGSRVLFSHTLIDRRSSDTGLRNLTAPYSASLSWIESWPHNWTSTLTVLRMGPIAGSSGFVPNFEYIARPYTSMDLRLSKTFKLNSSDAELSLSAINLGRDHQEIADRSAQREFVSQPLNRTSPMIWLTLSIQSR